MISELNSLMRVLEPPEDEAPRYDAVIEAMKSTYGEPTIFRNRTVYECHFDKAGTLLDSRDGQDCGNRFTANREDSRVVMLQRPELDSMSLVAIYAGQQPCIKQGSEQGKLRVAPGCAYSIIYNVRPRESGVLYKMTALAYAHDPVRSDIWEERMPRLSEEISEELALQQTSRDIAPDL